MQSWLVAALLLGVHITIHTYVLGKGTYYYSFSLKPHVLKIFIHVLFCASKCVFGLEFEELILDELDFAKLVLLSSVC